MPNKISSVFLDSIFERNNNRIPKNLFSLSKKSREIYAFKINPYEISVKSNFGKYNMDNNCLKIDTIYAKIEDIIL